jgi:hypothetical protein
MKKGIRLSNHKDEYKHKTLKGLQVVNEHMRNLANKFNNLLLYFPLY